MEHTVQNEIYGEAINDDLLNSTYEMVNQDEGDMLPNNAYGAIEGDMLPNNAYGGISMDKQAEDGYNKLSWDTRVQN